METIDIVTMQDVDEGWQVHRHGCADVARLLKRGKANDVQTVTTDDIPSAIQKNIDEWLAGMDYTVDDFRIMPCI